ncbi:LysM peptidoglycan-binding domain-containing protein [Haloferula sargassicola]|uniref:LysM peptidoglycan-binding domain-containing protein n=1 Tax=Haloferula sargassicola TaxID=490096 RepID=UPI0033656DE5
MKRRTVKKSKFRKLFANVSKKNKRHRATTAAAISPEELEGDVPNLGIGKALLVILAIHVVAIGGIFYHSYRLDRSNEPEQASTATKRVVKAPGNELAESAAIRVTPSIARAVDPTQDEVLPVFRASDQIYSAGTGDTYATIAERFGIDEMELRAANDNIPLRQGRRLRIPPKSITAVEPEEIASLRVVPAPEPEPASAREALDELVATDAAVALDRQVAEAPKAVPVPHAASTPKPKPASGKGSYKVKSGDTFWSIAKRNDVPVNRLMEANGITDARKLRVGMSLVIPN